MLQIQPNFGNFGQELSPMSVGKDVPTEKSPNDSFTVRATVKSTMCAGNLLWDDLDKTGSV